MLCVSFLWFYFVRLDRIVIAMVPRRCTFSARCSSKDDASTLQCRTAALLTQPVDQQQPYYAFSTPAFKPSNQSINRKSA